MARLEKRLQKARDVEAKRKKQASEARAEVAQLTAQVKALQPAPTRARSVAAPAADPAAAKPAAAKPQVAVTSERSGVDDVGVDAAENGVLARHANGAHAEGGSADGSGDGTGPS